MTDFGRLICKIQMENGDSSKDMASKLFISPSYLSAIVYGKRKVPESFVDDLTKVYNLSFDEIEKLKQLKDLNTTSKRTNLTDFAKVKIRTNT